MRRIAAHPRLLAAPLLAVVLLVGVFLLVRDASVFRVERVTVVGASGPEAPRIRAALTEAATSMTTLHVRTGALRDAVSSFPTVRGVRVDRQLFHGLKVIVVGRPAVATLNANGDRIAVAADGTLLRGAQIPHDVPTVRIPAPPAGSRLSDRRAERALALVAAAPGPMRDHLATAFFGRRGLEAEVRNGPAIILGDGNRLRAKWIAAARVLGDPGARGATYVDVRVPERAVAGGLEPQTSTTG